MKQNLTIILILLTLAAVIISAVIVYRKKYEKPDINILAETILGKVQLKYGFTTDQHGTVYFPDGTTA